MKKFSRSLTKLAKPTKRRNPDSFASTLMLGMILGAVGWIVLTQKYVTPAFAETLRNQQTNDLLGLQGGL